jgi:thiosulfate/3-mercaptopyruvate sulfurtransferase
MRKLLQLATGLVLAAATAACLVQVPRANPLPRWDPSLLVSAEDLRLRLDDPRTVIVHVGRDLASYEAGHIRGARFLPFSTIVTTRDGVPNELPPVEQLREAFEAAGVSDGSRVVLYGDLDGLLAARAFFTLDYLGKQNVALLDGGLTRWRQLDLPVSTGSASWARGTLTPRPRPELVVDAEWVRARLDDTAYVLVDARPGAEFTGEVPGDGVARPGHIPGAHSIFWRSALISDADPRLRSPQVLHADFVLAGASLGDTIVVYCRTGVQASHAYFVARYLRRPVVLYDGSYIDWSARGDAYPVATGAGS